MNIVVESTQGTDLVALVDAVGMLQCRKWQLVQALGRKSASQTYGTDFGCTQGFFEWPPVFGHTCTISFPG